MLQAPTPTSGDVGRKIFKVQVGVRRSPVSKPQPRARDRPTPRVLPSVSGRKMAPLQCPGRSSEEVRRGSRSPSREGGGEGPRRTDSPRPPVRPCRAGNLSEYQVPSPEGGKARFRARSRGPSFGPLEGIRSEISVRTVWDGVPAQRSRTRGSRSQPARRSSPVEPPEHGLGPGGRRTSGRMDIFDSFQQHPKHPSNYSGETPPLGDRPVTERVGVWAWRG